MLPTLSKGCVVAFADPPPPAMDLSHLSVSSKTRTPAPPESIVPTENVPHTLMEWAVLILKTADPMLKVRVLSRQNCPNLRGRVKSIRRFSGHDMLSTLSARDSSSL